MKAPQDVLQEYLDGIEAIDTVAYRKDEKMHHKSLNIKDVNEINRQRIVFTVAIDVLNQAFSNPKLGGKVVYQKNARSKYWEVKKEK